MKEIVLPQVVSVGIYNAQIAIKNRTVSKNRKTTMFELELPIGSGGMSYIDDESRTIDENIIICAKPGQMRHTRLPFECYYIHMIVNHGQLYDTLMRLSNYIEIPDPAHIRDIFMQMYQNYRTGASENELMLHSLVLELVYLLNQYSTKASAKKYKSSNRAIIENTIDYIQNNLTSALNLELLASEAKLTPSYFHKLFKASTGKNLHEYIEEQRIKKAINLMLSTDMTLTQISYECGFSSQSYFSYAFKRKMQTSPRAYIKKLYGKYEE